MDAFRQFDRREYDTAAGHLSPVGNGWWRYGGPRSQFDQQPIEATAMLLAAEAAFDLTSADRYRATVERSYAWFLGANDAGVVVVDPERGACHDGLTPSGVNLNIPPAIRAPQIGIISPFYSQLAAEIARTITLVSPLFELFRRNLPHLPENMAVNCAVHIVPHRLRPYSYSRKLKAKLFNAGSRLDIDI